MHEEARMHEEERRWTEEKEKGEAREKREASKQKRLSGEMSSLSGLPHHSYATCLSLSLKLSTARSQNQ